MEQGKMGAADINELDDADFGKVVGRMMRQFNRMQWFDLITGQGDRHADNYLMEIDKTDLSVTVKTIDNDASYGVFRQGLYKFRMQSDSVMNSAFNEAIDKKFGAVIAGKGDRKTFRGNVLSDNGVTRLINGTIEIDLKKADNPLLLGALLNFSGLKNVVPPAEIDKELYDKLMTLASDAPDGGQARKNYLSSLAERLGKGSDQYAVAVRRLDESIAHARSLAAAGKVYTAEQWENHDVQRDIAAPNKSNMDKELNTYGIPLKEGKMEVYAHKGRYVSYTNTFFRDFHQVLIAGKTHANWFDDQPKE
jgi:hypothetical protein